MNSENDFLPLYIGHFDLKRAYLTRKWPRTQIFHKFYQIKDICHQTNTHKLSEMKSKFITN